MFKNTRIRVTKRTNFVQIHIIDTKQTQRRIQEPNSNDLI